MELFTHIMLIILMLITASSAVKYPFDKLTMYKKSDISYQPAWFVLLFMFFGIFMFLFIKPIRQFRKNYYIKNKIRSYEFWNLTHNLFPMENPDQFPEPYNLCEKDKYWNEYINNKRYLKLQRIQRKSKRNVFIGKFKF